jgi:hypothetical protein
VLSGSVLALTAAALAAVPAGAVPHGGAPANRTGATGRVALDGTWWTRADPAAAGERRGWARGGFEGAPVRLPHVPNAQRVTGAAGVAAHEGSVSWYRTTLRVPATGRYALRFESVNHEATVWLDGRRVGRHVGEYLPFEVRRRLEAARAHTLVVRADFRSPDRMKATGWHRTWFNFGGVNREVTLRALGPAEVQAPTVTTRRAGRDAVVDVAATIRAAPGPPRRVAPTGTLTRRGRAVATLRFRAVRVAGGRSRRVRARVRVSGAALWSPGAPALHDLVLRAGPDGGGWRGRVGLREVTRRGPRLQLNGRPLVLRGASVHEDVPSRGDALRPADADAIVARLRAIGANATRAQHPLSPMLLERLDAAGILVWMGIGPVDAPGAWTSRGPALARQARERVRATVRQAQTHPSVLAWNLANEVAGQGHPAGQREHVAGAARELRRMDPGRLVALDVWGAHPPRADGPMYRDVDAIGWTNYLGWYEGTDAPPARTAAAIRARLADLRRAFPDRVVVVTEFGAEGNGRNPSGRPGSLDFQARLLATHLRTYAGIDDLAGALVWNLSDFAVAPSFAGGSIRREVPDIDLRKGLNEKGLHTYAGEPKPAARVVARELARLGR